MFRNCVSKFSAATKSSKLFVNLKYFKVFANYGTDESKIIRSPVPQIDIPDVFLEDYVWKNLDKWENKTALECSETGRSYLYREVYKKSRALSNFLRNKIPQLKETDTLAIILPNMPEYPIIMLGIIQAGFRVTTINSHYKSDEIYQQLLNSDTKFVFTTKQLWPQVELAIQRLSKDIPVVIVKHEQSENLPTGTISFNETVEGNSDFNCPIKRTTEDVIILPYSSGTTGLAKGVELTHKCIVANLCQFSSPKFRIIHQTEGLFQDILPVLLPVYHIYGMVIVLLNGLASGTKLVTISKFKPEALIEVFKIKKPTVAYFAPPTVFFLSNNSAAVPELFDQTRTIVSGSAPLGYADITRLREKFRGKTSILQMYGLTEASPLSHSQTIAIENGVKYGGAGFTLPNTECLIIPNASQRQCSDQNTSGELLIRGPQVMKGYYKNPEATKATITEDGWLRTGDIGYFDKNGHLFITDRLKELIKVKGFQVAPAELEEVLRSHSDVEDAAVIGVPDANYGEVPRAFIVPKNGVKINTNKINDYVASKVASYKQLNGGIILTDSIPKSRSGKILRRLLKKL